MPRDINTKGWAEFAPSKKAHYFDGDFRTVCGAFLFAGPLDPGITDDSPDCCKKCLARITPPVRKWKE